MIWVMHVNQMKTLHSWAVVWNLVKWSFLSFQTKEKPITSVYWSVRNVDNPQVILRISSNGADWRIFWRFEIFDSGIFFGEENLASIFWGGFRWYDEETNTNIQFLMFLFFALYHLMPSGKIFKARKFCVWSFGGSFLVQGFLWVFVRSPSNIFWFSSLSLEIQSTPWEITLNVKMESIDSINC